MFQLSPSALPIESPEVHRLGTLSHKSPASLPDPTDSSLAAGMLLSNVRSIARYVHLEPWKASIPVPPLSALFVAQRALPCSSIGSANTGDGIDWTSQVSHPSVTRPLLLPESA